MLPHTVYGYRCVWTRGWMPFAVVGFAVGLRTRGWLRLHTPRWLRLIATVTHAHARCGYGLVPRGYGCYGSVTGWVVHLRWLIYHGYLYTPSLPFYAFGITGCTVTVTHTFCRLRTAVHLPATRLIRCSRLDDSTHVPVTTFATVYGSHVTRWMPCVGYVYVTGFLYHRLHVYGYRVGCYVGLPVTILRLRLVAFAVTFAGLFTVTLPLPVCTRCGYTVGLHTRFGCPLPRGYAVCRILPRLRCTVTHYTRSWFYRLLLPRFFAFAVTVTVTRILRLRVGLITAVTLRLQLRLRLRLPRYGYGSTVTAVATVRCRFAFGLRFTPRLHTVDYVHRSRLPVTVWVTTRSVTDYIYRLRSPALTGLPFTFYVCPRLPFTVHVAVYGSVYAALPVGYRFCLVTGFAFTALRSARNTCLTGSRGWVWVRLRLRFTHRYAVGLHGWLCRTPADVAHTHATPAPRLPHTRLLRYAVAVLHVTHLCVCRTRFAVASHAVGLPRLLPVEFTLGYAGYLVGSHYGYGWVTPRLRLCLCYALRTPALCGCRGSCLPFAYLGLVLHWLPAVYTPHIVLRFSFTTCPAGYLYARSHSSHGYLRFTTLQLGSAGYACRAHAHTAHTVLRLRCTTFLYLPVHMPFYIWITAVRFCRLLFWLTFYHLPLPGSPYVQLPGWLFTLDHTPHYTTFGYTHTRFYTFTPYVHGYCRGSPHTTRFG